MKGHFKLIAGIGLFVLLLTGCNSSTGGGGGSDNPPVIQNSFTITWKNYNGTILEIDNNVKEGTTPTYDGTTPTRPADDEYTYTWSGWDPKVTPATANQTYTATYSYEKIKTEYVISFDLNGGTSTSYNGSKTVESFTKDIFFFDCKKDGWNFRGWLYKGTKIFDEKGNQLANPTMEKTMTFVAMYAQTAKMTIVSNLEGAGNITGEGEYPYNTYVDVSAHPKQGYNFVGWYFENTLLSNTEDYKYMMWSEDVTLEARFKLASFLINVHTNNENYGLVLLKSPLNNNYLPTYQEYRDYTIQVTIAAYSKTDVRFLGWYGTDNKLVETNAVYSFAMPNHDYTLEAKWNYFTVSYVLNGGTNDASNPTSYTIDSSKTILHNPTRTDYDFVGWTYNGKTVTEVDPAWVDNVTLVANWKAHTYSITYELNGGINDAYNPSTYTIESDTITLKDPSRNGYTFLGWYKTSTFSSRVTTINKDSHGDLILYAKWTPTVYSITYNLNGGTNASSNPSTYTIESSFVLAAPSKTGYTFLGWFDNSGNKITSITAGTTGALVLTAHWNEGNAYSITLDPNGGSVSETLINVQYDHNYSLPTPIRLGYTFQGWYDGSTKINNTGSWKYTSDKKLVAHWTITKYSITYNLNGGTNNPSNPSSYTVEDTVTFAVPSKTGYTFLGWFDNSGNKITSITAGITGALVLTAHWNEGDAFTATLDANGGEVYQTSVNVQYDHNYSLPTPTRLGYTFDGWYNGSTKVNNTGTWKYTSNKTFVAHWTVINYSINYTINGGTNDPSNPSSYTVEDAVTFAAPFKTGYTFLGWFNGDNVVTGIPTGSTGTVNIEARWSADLHMLSVTSQDTSKGTVAIASGSGYSDESITVIATPVGDCIFKGWYHGETKISDNQTYTFSMPTNDYSLVARFFTKAEEEEEAWNIAHGVIPTLSEDGKTITYGLYPQTNVNDSSLISSLNALTTPESNGWYLFNNEYYAKVSANPYSSSYKFDNGTTIVNGTTYWFKCEPIVWNVLSDNNGEYYILSSVLLDAHCYYNSTSSRTIDGKTIYPNNYEYSDIRTWLNNDFYNSAFALDNSYIQTTKVDNSAATTNSSSNSYACNNTQDKVFLPSYKDYINSSYGFSTSTSSTNTRYCKTTDWARARGADYYTSSGSSYQFNGEYWTRSPYSDGSNDAWHVDYNGYLRHIIGGVRYTDPSVRPALTIKIA